jgi:hypothetical protein
MKSFNALYTMLLAGMIVTNYAKAQIITHPSGKIEIPNVSSSDGPTGNGSLLWFSSGSTNTVIQENWGLNLIGAPDRPIKVYNSSLLVGYPSNNEQLPINNVLVNGKIGIGTKTPNSRLSISKADEYSDATASSTTVDALMEMRVPYVSSSPNSYNGSGYRWGITFNGSNESTISTGNKTSAIYAVSEDTGSGYNRAVGLAFHTSSFDALNSERLRITADGNVGVGTVDTKGYKLAVAGNMVAEAVTVKLRGSWPDYVFTRSYNLRSLAEVKDYIDKNQHLPEMPSEAEVDKDGISLGEMNMKLLKKVEELTLYLIDAKGENDIQKKQINFLIKEVTAMKKGSQKSSTKR